jgi:glycosyltransferase involved in cell wall biosynthesis
MYKKIKVYFKNKNLEKKLKKDNKFYDYQNNTHITSAKKVLIIDDKLPEFDKDSGSRRLNIIIDILLQNQVTVYLIGDFKEYKYKTDYVAYYRNKGVIVYEPSLDESGKLITKEQFIAVISDSLNFVWLHRPLIFKKYHSIIKKYNSKVKIAFDMVDFHYLRMKRESELKNNSKLLEEANKFLEIELNNAQLADEIIVISETDKANFATYFPDVSKMKVISNIHNFINDNHNFKSFDERKGLLFVGSFDHLPNVDAVNYLKDEIMPLIWNTNPDIQLTVVGSNPPQNILNLNAENFRVLGYVEDLTEYFNTSRLFIAPLRYGAGIKGKIGQSMEFGLPLVTTDVGAEGFEFGTLYHTMVANQSDVFAQLVVNMYTDEDLWNSVSANSKRVLEPFSLSQTTRTIMSMLD